MSKYLIDQRNGFTGKMPASMPRHFAIIIGGEYVEMDQATHDAVMAKSKSEKISAEAAFASIHQIGAAA